MQKYRGAFARHDVDRWTTYITKLSRGEARIKVTGLAPHEILARNLDDPVTLAQWEAVKLEFGASLQDVMAICDVSGSMMGGPESVVPLDISVAIGALVADTSRHPLITFSESPYILDVRGLPLKEKMHAIRRAGGLNTDLMAVFRLILQRELTPKTIVIISDMQFDQANPDRYDTNTYTEAKQLYEMHGRTLPKVIFWNVAAALQTFPVQQDEIGVCMVTGYSHNVLRQVLRGEITDPYQVMLGILNSERYQRIKLAQDAVEEHIIDIPGEDSWYIPAGI